MFHHKNPASPQLQTQTITIKCLNDEKSSPDPSSPPDHSLIITVTTEDSWCSEFSPVILVRVEVAGDHGSVAESSAGQSVLSFLTRSIRGELNKHLET